MHLKIHPVFHANYGAILLKMDIICTYLLHVSSDLLSLFTCYTWTDHLKLTARLVWCGMKPALGYFSLDH